MADVQVEHGYTRVANSLLTAIALAPWDGPSQASLVMALIRATYGFQRRDAELGATDWKALTGLHGRSLRRARKALHDAGVIILVRDFDARAQRPACWRLQKDFGEWGRFTPAPEAIDEAEGQLRTLGSRLTPGVTADPGDLGSPVTPPLGSQLSGPLGSRLTPGAPSKSVGDNDSQRGKESSLKKEKEIAAAFAHTREGEEFVSSVIAGANEAMGANNAIDQRRLKPIATSQGASRQAVFDWLKEGIPADVILEVVFERARAYRPSGRSKQISSLKYLSAAVREEWTVRKLAGSQAGSITEELPGQGRPRGKPPPDPRQRSAAWAEAHPEAAAEIRRKIIAELEAEGLEPEQRGFEAMLESTYDTRLARAAARSDAA